MQYATNLYKERHSISRKIFPWAAFWFLNDIICCKSSTETDIQLQERFSPRSALWFLQDIMCSKFFCKKRYIVFMKRFPQDLPLRCYVQQILYKKKEDISHSRKVACSVSFLLIHCIFIYCTCKNAKSAIQRFPPWASIPYTMITM